MISPEDVRGFPGFGKGQKCASGASSKGCPGGKSIEGLVPLLPLTLVLPKLQIRRKSLVPSLCGMEEMKFQFHLVCCGFGFVAVHLEKCQCFAYSLAPSLSKFSQADKQSLHSVYQTQDKLPFPSVGAKQCLIFLLITKKERLI